MAFITSGLIGTDLGNTTPGTTTDGAGAKHRLGERAHGTDGSEWVYVQAGAAITQYSALLVDENFQAVMMTSTLATAASGSAGNFVAFAQVAFSDNDFGWVAVKGSNIRCRLSANCAADVRLFSTSSAGKLDDASGSSVLINGVVAVAAITATTDQEIIASNPVSRLKTGIAT